MSKYVPDVSSRRWVIISSNRVNKPENYDDNPENDTEACPFCEGNEHLTPKEVFRIGEGKSDEKGWDVRVIENKYPITDFHEVIIHSPEETDLHKLTPEHMSKVFQAYRERFNYYCKQGQVIIFCNQGEHAGASIGHPHSQLVVLPNQINLSALCREPLKNVVRENTHFDVYCPDFSQWPYEVWIVPKKDDTIFGNITDEEITDLADLYRGVMEKLETIYDEKSKTGKGFSYNFYIYPKENWYLRIIPRMVHRAGFELGTGLSVNVTDPEDVAKELRDGDETTSESPEQQSTGTSGNGVKPEEVEEPPKTKEEQIEDLKAKLAALGVE